ncbi:MAG: GlsB/YeaQ/YmgE family stress response membrane protein [Erythrobacter sp.]
MALILLLLTGSVLGWLASIMARTETRSGILRDIGVGVVGALGGGIMANHGSILGGLAAQALIAGIAAAVVLLAIYNLLIRPNLNS